MSDQDQIAALAAQAAQSGGAPPQVMAASVQETHRRFNFDVQTGPEGARFLVLTDVLPSGVPLVDHVFPFQNPDNADALGKKLSAPGVVLPGQNANGHL
jgi:hypothetical protein